MSRYLLATIVVAAATGVLAAPVTSNAEQVWSADDGTVTLMFYQEPLEIGRAHV